MKTLFRTVAVVLLCGAMMIPSIDAQNRGRGRGGSPTHAPATAPASRPGNTGNRPGNTGNRPGNGGSRPGNMGDRPGNTGNRPGNGGNRPGNNGNRPGNNGNRPGNNGHHNWRPGNDRPGGPGGNQGNRPGNGNHPGVRPGHDRPGHPGHPGYQRPPAPGHVGHHGPMRPHMRPPRPFHRPVPPPAWRPAPGWRPFHSILGVTLGTAFNLSINALINSGYTVSSYGNNQIYLSNVPMLNLMWPDAIMYYNAAGQLYGSQFVYSTPGYNMNQYNMAYTSLTGAYGAPYSLQNTASGIEASWWGTGGQFIRLSYQSDYANNGMLRFYTTLSFGN